MKNLITLLMLLSLSLFARAADVQKLIHDTQQLAQTSDRVTLVWWIPSEFWSETLKGNPNLTEAQRAAFLAGVEDYSMFAVVVADIGAMGGITPRSREAIASNVTFKIGDEVMPLLENDALSADAQNLVAIMKPVLANMLGQFGKGIEFMIYSNKKAGKKILSAVGEKRFSYTVFEKRFDWRLPLGSLLPARFDPETGEEFAGDYRFNPFTGKPLIVKDAPAKP
jgi:hypothetical protein